jgi:signal recognition particle receptor subunit beta
MQEVSVKALAVVDVPGHFHFREQLTDSVEIAKAIVVLIDSKEKEKFGEAAEILYEIINKIALLDHQVPIVIAWNKQDL